MKRMTKQFDRGRFIAMSKTHCRGKSDNGVGQDTPKLLIYNHWLSLAKSKL